MATLTISKVSACAGGNHFTLRFALGAQSIDIATSLQELNAINVDAEMAEGVFKGLLALLLRIYTPQQLATKISAGVSVTL